MLKRMFYGMLLLVLIFTVYCAGPANAAAAAGQPIVVQGAMDLEVKDLVAALQNPTETTYGSWTFWQGNIGNQPVVVSRTEVGLTNAAAATLLAIEKFHPKAIINQGTAGGHDPALFRFDIVLGQKAVNFGKFKSNHAAAGAGVHPENWIPENVSLRQNGQENEFAGFTGDPGLLKIAQSVADTYKYGKVVPGVIGSADEWNRELDRIQWVHQKFQTSVEEMETASAAQVAAAFNLPFLGIRILSNSEPQDQGWDPRAGSYCQEYVIQVIKALGQAEAD